MGFLIIREEYARLPRNFPLVPSGSWLTEPGIRASVNRGSHLNAPQPEAAQRQPLLLPVVLLLEANASWSKP